MSIIRYGHLNSLNDTTNSLFIFKCLINLCLMFTFSEFQVVNDSNIQYLNPDDDDEPGVQLYVTQVPETFVQNESLDEYVWVVW